MAYTDTLRRQHDELLQIVGQISGKLHPEAIRRDAVGVRALLSTLAGKLSVHLAMEDKVLYPALVASDDPAAKALATRFMEELGGLGTAFGNYNTQWQAGQIGSDPAGFCQATQAVFSALGKRVERENAELYPAADRIKAR